MPEMPCSLSARFLSTPSARRATALSKLEKHLNQISIHALREEGDIVTSVALLTSSKFLSTPSARRATSSPLRERHGQDISIHALREEGDPLLVAAQHDGVISIHALREEGDGRWNKGSFRLLIFLSTPSARRATRIGPPRASPEPFLSTPSARRATLPRPTIRTQAVAFLSTPSARRATALHIRTVDGGAISIHALREEGDG